MGTPKESAIALRADHKTICSFDSIDDKNCRKVMSEVKRLVDEVKRNNNMMVRSHLSPDTPEHPHHPRPHSMPPNTKIPASDIPKYPVIPKSESQMEQRKNSTAMPAYFTISNPITITNNSTGPVPSTEPAKQESKDEPSLFDKAKSMGEKAAVAIGIVGGIKGGVESLRPSKTDTAKASSEPSHRHASQKDIKTHQQPQLSSPALLRPRASSLQPSPRPRSWHAPESNNVPRLLPPNSQRPLHHQDLGALQRPPGLQRPYGQERPPGLQRPGAPQISNTSQFHTPSLVRPPQIIVNSPNASATIRTGSRSRSRSRTSTLRRHTSTSRSPSAIRQGRGRRV